MKIDSNGVPTIEEGDVCLTQTDCGDSTKDVEIYRDSAGLYYVISGGIVRHPQSSAEDVMRALSWYLNSALTPAKPPAGRCMKTPADFGDIKGETLAQRMMSICGCTGQYDCDCVSVRNQALSELSGELNLQRQTTTALKS